MKCPNCGNTTDFDIKPNVEPLAQYHPYLRNVRCDKCGFNGSESEFAEQK